MFVTCRAKAYKRTSGIGASRADAAEKCLCARQRACSVHVESVRFWFIVRVAVILFQPTVTLFERKQSWTHTKA